MNTNSIYFEDVEVGDWITLDFLCVRHSWSEKALYYIDINNHIIYKKLDGEHKLIPCGEWRMYDEKGN